MIASPDSSDPGLKLGSTKQYITLSSQLAFCFAQSNGSVSVRGTRSYSGRFLTMYSAWTKYVRSMNVQGEKKSFAVRAYVGYLYLFSSNGIYLRHLLASVDFPEVLPWISVAMVKLKAALFGISDVVLYLHTSLLASAYQILGRPVKSSTGIITRESIPN